MIFFHMFLENFSGTFFVRSDEIASITDTFYGSFLKIIADLTSRLPFFDLIPFLLTFFFLLSVLYREFVHTNNFDKFVKLDTSNPILVATVLYLTTTFLFQPTTINVVKLNAIHGSPTVDQLTIVDQLKNVPRILTLPSTISNTFIYGISYTMESTRAIGDTYDRFEQGINELHLGMLFSASNPEDAYYYYYPNIIGIDSISELRDFYINLGKVSISDSGELTPRLDTDDDTRGLISAAYAEQSTRSHAMGLKPEFISKLSGTYYEAPFLGTDFLSDSATATIGINKLGTYVGAEIKDAPPLLDFGFYLPSAGFIDNQDDETKKALCESLGTNAITVSTATSRGRGRYTRYNTIISSTFNPFLYEERWDNDLRSSCEPIGNPDLKDIKKNLDEIAKSKITDAISELNDYYTPIPTPTKTKAFTSPAIAPPPEFYHLLKPSVPEDLKTPFKYTTDYGGLLQAPIEITTTTHFPTIKGDKFSRQLKFLFAYHTYIKSNSNDSVSFQANSNSPPPSPNNFLTDIDISDLVATIPAENPTDTKDNHSLSHYDAMLSKILLHGQWNRSDIEHITDGNQITRTQYLKTVFYNSMLSYAMLRNLSSDETNAIKDLFTDTTTLHSTEKIYQASNNNQINHKDLATHAIQGINEFYASSPNNAHDPQDILATTISFILFHRFKDLMDTKPTKSSCLSTTFAECNRIVFKNVLYQASVDNFFSYIDLSLYTTKDCINVSACSAKSEKIFNGVVNKTSYITPRIIPYLSYKFFTQNRGFPSASIQDTPTASITTVREFLCKANRKSAQDEIDCEKSTASPPVFTVTNADFSKKFNDKALETKSTNKFDAFGEEITVFGSIIDSITDGIMWNVLRTILTFFIDLFDAIYFFAYDYIHSIPGVSTGKIYANNTIVNLLNVIETGSIKWLDMPTMPTSPTALNIAGKIHPSELSLMSSYLSLALLPQNQLITPHTANKTPINGLSCTSTAGFTTFTALTNSSNCNNTLQFIPMIINNIAPFLFYAGNPEIHNATALDTITSQKLAEEAASKFEKAPAHVNEKSIWNGIFATQSTSGTLPPPYLINTDSKEDTPLATLTLIYLGFTQAMQDLAFENAKDGKAKSDLNSDKMWNAVEIAVTVATLGYGTAAMAAKASAKIAATATARQAGKLVAKQALVGPQLPKGILFAVKRGLSNATIGGVARGIGRVTVGTIKTVSKAGWLLAKPFLLFKGLLSTVQDFAAPIIVVIAILAFIILAIVLFDFIIFFLLLRSFIIFAKFVLQKYAIPMALHFLTLMTNLIKYIFNLFRPSSTPRIASIFEETLEKSFLNSITNLAIVSFFLSLTIFLFNQIFDLLWVNVSVLAIRSAFENGAPASVETILAATLLVSLISTKFIMELIDVLSPKQKSLKDLMGDLKSKS